MIKRIMDYIYKIKSEKKTRELERLVLFGTSDKKVVKHKVDILLAASTGYYYED